jgi:hypothetical protein
MVGQAFSLPRPLAGAYFLTFDRRIDIFALSREIRMQ